MVNVKNKSVILKGKKKKERELFITDINRDAYKYESNRSSRSRKRNMKKNAVSQFL